MVLSPLLLAGCGAAPDVSLAKSRLMGLGAEVVHDNRGDAFAPFRRHLQDPSQPSELSMVLLGDSIGSSTFAGTKTGQNLGLRDGLKILRALTLQYFIPETDEEYIERLGKITSYKRFNAFVGDKAWSHRKQIEQVTGRRVSFSNYSIPGARSDHLEIQLERFQRDYQFSDRVPSYVALSVGGNDFCDSLPVNVAQEKLYNSIRKVREVSPQSLVVVSGIPDIVGVFENYERLAFRFGPVRFSCRDRANLFPMCERSADLLSGDPADTARARRDLARYQEAFALVAATITAEFPEEPPVVYAELPPTGFGEGMVAADCFHPGKKGHESIARATWQPVEAAFSF